MIGDRHSLVFSGTVASNAQNSFAGSNKIPWRSVARRVVFQFSPGMMGLVFAGFFADTTNSVSTTGIPPGTSLLSQYGNARTINGVEQLELVLSEPIVAGSYLKLYVNNTGDATDATMTAIIELEEV